MSKQKRVIFKLGIVKEEFTFRQLGIDPNWGINRQCDEIQNRFKDWLFNCTESGWYFKDE